MGIIKNDRLTGNDLLKAMAGENNESSGTETQDPSQLIDITGIQETVKKATGSHARVTDISPAESTQTNTGFAIISKDKEEE